jgi:hypothetical protein
MCVFESTKDTRYSHICISVPLSPSLQVYQKHCLTSWITLRLFLPHTSISTKFTYTRSMLSCQPRASQNRRIPDVCLSLFPLSRNQTRNKTSIRPMFSCRDLRAQNQKGRGTRRWVGLFSGSSSPYDPKTIDPFVMASCLFPPISISQKCELSSFYVRPRRSALPKLQHRTACFCISVA